MNKLGSSTSFNDLFSLLQRRWAFFLMSFLVVFLLIAALPVTFPLAHKQENFREISQHLQLAYYRNLKNNKAVFPYEPYQAIYQIVHSIIPNLQKKSGCSKRQSKLFNTFSSMAYKRHPSIILTISNSNKRSTLYVETLFKLIAQQLAILQQAKIEEIKTFMIKKLQENNKEKIELTKKTRIINKTIDELHRRYKKSLLLKLTTQPKNETLTSGLNILRHNYQQKINAIRKQNSYIKSGITTLTLPKLIGLPVISISSLNTKDKATSIEIIFIALILSLISATLLTFLIDLVSRIFRS